MIPTSRASELRALLDGAGALGHPLGQTEADALLDHLDGVYQWNEFAGLTNVPRSDAVRLHVLDSLSISSCLLPKGRVIDLGTGAGFPGIPLAIARPDLRLILVEARARRCSFLREMVRLLGLSTRVQVREIDANALAGEVTAEAVVSRAFLPPPELVRLASMLVSPTGRLIVMRGGEAATSEPISAQLAIEAGFTRAAQFEFTLPGGREARCVSVLDRIPR